jgi:acetyltransferase-like isoleucine patch superfamily enzyme
MKNFIRRYYGKYMVLESSNWDVNIPLFLLKSAYYHLFSKSIFAHHSTTISGIRNIETHGQLFLGTQEVAFLNKHDRTFLNIRGKLVIRGTVQIGKGCRLAISKGAICTLNECGVTGQTNLIIAHGLDIGKGSIVGWGSELVDEDFHAIDYEGKREEDRAIVIGEHVWIGSHVKILKGVHIGDNSVVAANAVVTKSFEENNVLIAGNPAQIIKRGINWT